jgi:hypothetical protein
VPHLLLQLVRHSQHRTCCLHRHASLIKLAAQTTSITLKVLGAFTPPLLISAAIIESACKFLPHLPLP